VAIKNGQSRDGNIWHTRHMTKTNKTENDEQHGPHQNTGVDLGDCEG